MFKKNNTLSLISGLVITVLGFYIWFHPLDTLILVALYLGIIFILAGAAYIIEFFHRKQERYLSFGLINIVVGVVLVSNGALLAKTLAIVLGCWILFSSIAQINSAFKFKKENLSFWIYPLLSGILGTIFSIIILNNPSAGVLTIAIIIGTYMIIYGIIEIFEYFILQDLEK